MRQRCVPLPFDRPAQMFRVVNRRCLDAAEEAALICPAQHIQRGFSMPLRREVQFLRERARRWREMADENPTPLSDRLRAMAHELEARADNLERAGLTDDEAKL